MIARTWPTLLILAACTGMASALVVRAPAAVLAVVVVATAATVAAPGGRASTARLVGGAPARGLVVGQREAGCLRPQPARTRDRALCDRRGGRDGADPPDGVRSAGPGGDARVSASSRSASACSSSSLWDGRRPRAPSSPSVRRPSRRASPTAASTSAPGSHVVASTSFSAAATGASWGGEVGSAVSPTASAGISRTRSRPGSPESAARSSSGSRSERTKGSRRSSRTASRPPGCTTSSRCRGRTSRSWRGPRWGSRGCSGSPDSWGSWPRSRRFSATSSRSAGSPPSSAPASRARSRRSPGCSRGRATAGTSSRSARPSCSRGRRRRCSSRGSSSRSLRLARSSCSYRRSSRTLEGYPIPRALARVLAVSTACGAATAPILWLQFGEVPLYSLLAERARDRRDAAAPRPRARGRARRARAARPRPSPWRG